MDNLQLKFLERGGRRKGGVRAGAIAAVTTDMQRVCTIMEELAVGLVVEAAAGRREANSLSSRQLEQERYDIPLDFSPSAMSKGAARREDMLEALSFFLSSVKKGDLSAFIQKFGSEPKISEILRKLSDVASLCTAEAKIILQYENDMEFDFYTYRKNLNHAIKSIAAKSGHPDEELMDCIIAKLDSVDFMNQILHFKHSEKNDLLKFKYSKDDLHLVKGIAEAVGFENNFLELLGNMKFKRDGSPSKISNLTEIRKVNLEKVTVTEVTTRDGVIEPAKPLVFCPELSKRKTIYEVDVGKFGNILFEQRRDFLVGQIYEYLAFVWESYAMEDDKNLDSEALKLKKTMLKTFKIRE